MSFPNLASNRHCTACGACIAVCKKKALKLYMSSDGHYYISLLRDLCVQCLACEKICPITNLLYIGTNDLTQTIPYIGWSNLSPYKENGTSGGVFGAVANQFIQEGGIVIGAMLEKNNCRHRVVKQVKDIPLLQGSKYIYSEITEIYDIIKNALNDNKKVLFSGLPCQVAGVLSFFARNPYKNNLFTIDLVCGGIPSTLLKESFLEQHFNAEILSFRKKEKYCLTISQDGQVMDLGTKNLMIAGFLSGLTYRASCYNCKYAQAHRMSDITLGDYWQKDAKYNSGVSLILLHNERMKKFFDTDCIHICRTKWKNFLYHNPKIVIGYTPWENRWERKLLSRLINPKIPFYYQNLIYASVFKKYDIVGIIYLLYKRIRSKVEHQRRLKIVQRILRG